MNAPLPISRPWISTEGLTPLEDDWSKKLDYRIADWRSGEMSESRMHKDAAASRS